MNLSIRFRLLLFLFPVVLIAGTLLGAEEATTSSTPLPGTQFLDWPEADLSERLMDGAHDFVERKIAEAAEKRAQLWNYDYASPAAYEKSVTPNRERFQKMIGVVDQRVSPVTLEKFGEGEIPGLVAEADTFRVWQVRWSVLVGVWSEGLLVEPHQPDHATGQISVDSQLVIPGLDLHSEQPRYVIMVPDTSETPEQLVGIAEGDLDRRELVRRLASNGFTVIIPAVLDRQLYLGENGDDPKLKTANQTHREWIYRQAFQMGRHPIGYEVQKVLAAVDWITAQEPEATIGVSGWGDGGQVAFYAGAIDTRIGATLVSGYFQSREKIWAEPIDRNLFGFLTEFGDAEISSLFPPRALLIDEKPGPHLADQKGESTHVPDLEFYRFGTKGSLGVGSSSWSFLFANRATTLLSPTLSWRFFRDPVLSVENPMGYLQNGMSANVDLGLAEDLRANFSAKARHERLFHQLEVHVQQLIRDADTVREEAFLYQAEPKLRPGKWSTDKEHPTLDPKNFIKNAKAFRQQFATEAMGAFDEVLLPANARTRMVAETDQWTAWDVVLDVYPELFAWGTLVLPKDLKPDEKRPVVVCQHGRNGLPRDTIDGGKTAYNDYAAKLAERGFITFAPHNLYRGEDRYRWLDRKANAVGATLFSFIIPSHRQILDWLKTQPNVDPERIAFYGLSYGGESAMRIPPVIEDYAVVICSGDFNQWTRKVAAIDYPGTFMKSIEWEMPYWNLGNTFDYAEMAYLIFPRPFMVERGHHDGVAIDSRVAHEYAKVRHLYAQFGLADRTEIEFFQGGHSINGQGTFDFLHRHLNWPRMER